MARFWKSVGALIVIAISGWLAIDSFVYGPQDGEVLAIPSDRFAAVQLVPAEALGDRVRLFLTIRSGSADGDGNSAVAHYLEHLVFYNAKAGNPQDYQENASTFEHHVMYVSDTNRSMLGTGIDLLGNYFRPLSLKPDVFAREKNIIRREYALKRANDPFYPGIRAHYRHLHRMDDLADSMQSPEDIEHLSEPDTRRVHEQEYRQENAVLTVVGDISPSALSRALERSSLPRLKAAASPSIPAYRVAPAGVTGNRVALSGIAAERLMWTKIVPVRHDHLLELLAARDLTYEVLDSTLPGSLARSLRYDHKLASSFNFGFLLLDLDYLMVDFSATPDLGVPIETLRKEFENTLAGIARNGVPEETFLQVKKRLIEAELANETPEDGALSRALDPIGQAIPPYSHEDYIAALNGLTRETVDRFMSSLAAPGPVEVTYFEKE